MLTADTDPDVFRGGSVTVALSATRRKCEAPTAEPALCATVASGPLFVTDLHASGCELDVYVFSKAKEGGEPSWAVAGANLAVHGARLLVRADERLIVAVREGDDPGALCQVLWAGFVPYRDGKR